MNAPRPEPLPAPRPMPQPSPRAFAPPRRQQPPVVFLVPQPPRMRCSDADRNRIIEQLEVHYADGRLRMDEFEDRTAVALAATYVDELPRLLAELPPVPARRLPRTRAHRHFCADRTLLAGGLVALVATLFVFMLSPGDPEPARYFLLTVLSLPISIAFALVLGLPCPRHHDARGR